MNTSTGIGLLVLILAILFIIFMPLLVIWSLNTLFGFTIAYSLTTWFAVLVLGIFVRGSCTSKK